MNPPVLFSRRAFLPRVLALPAAASLGGRALAAEAAVAGKYAPPIVLFTKVTAQAGLTLEQTVELVAGAGLAGVDCPVRPKDEILPERVRDDLPRYAGLLKAKQLQLALLTTAIVKPESPHAADILSTARQLGVRRYRLGFLNLGKADSTVKLIAETRAQLTALAELNRDLGMCAVLQNHSPSGGSTYLGGDLRVMSRLVEDFDPAQIGVAFDLGHAIIVHGDEWPVHLQRLAPHVRLVYVKDADRSKRFVPFGEGEYAKTDYFKRLRAMGYSAPISMHIEYDWDEAGKARTPENLAKAVNASAKTLRAWLATA